MSWQILTWANASDLSLDEKPLRELCVYVKYATRYAHFIAYYRTRAKALLN